MSKEQHIYEETQYNLFYFIKKKKGWLPSEIDAIGISVKVNTTKAQKLGMENNSVCKLKPPGGPR